MSTVTLHNEKKKTLVPQLRFQEFDGEWKRNYINNVASKLNVGFVGTCEPFYTSSSEGVLLVRTGNLKGINIVLDDEKYVTKEFHNKNKKSQIYPGDLLLARHGGNGEICMVPKEFPNANCLNIVILRTNFEIDSIYFQLTYSCFSVQKQISAVTAGSTQGVINTKEISKLEIVYPTLPEQQKIASFLSAVDEKIQQLTRKASLLEQYKKGVMQQLFSGKLRFKDENGEDYPDWEEKKLGELGELKNGLNKDKKDFGFGSPFVNLMNVFGKSEIYNQEFDLVNSNEKEKILYNILKGDVLFIRSSVKRSGVGETVIVQEDLLDTVYSGFLIRFRDDKKSLAQDFKKYCFSSQSFRNELLSYATSSANTNINQESLNKVIVKLPCINEQQKIANFLSGIDSKIEKVNQQLAQTQTFKKGLLQQMFV
jgi:type I restriction enzyme S subunit